MRVFEMVENVGSGHLDRGDACAVCRGRRPYAGAVFGLPEST